jgi:hypothetical protein
MRFEDLVADAGAWAERIAGFVDMDKPDEFIEYVAQSARPEIADRWRDALDDETLERVRPHMAPLLSELGYDW